MPNLPHSPRPWKAGPGRGIVYDANGIIITTPWGEMPQVDERRDYIIACVNAVHEVGGDPQTVFELLKAKAEQETNDASPCA